MTAVALRLAARMAWWLSTQGQNLEALAQEIEARIETTAKARRVSVDEIYSPLWR